MNDLERAAKEGKKIVVCPDALVPALEEVLQGHPYIVHGTPFLPLPDRPNEVFIIDPEFFKKISASFDWASIEVTQPLEPTDIIKITNISNC